MNRTSNNTLRILKLFLSGNFSQQTLEKFHRWITSPCETEEKDAALLELWNRLDGEMAAGSGNVSRAQLLCRPCVRLAIAVAAVVIPLMVVAGFVWLRGNGGTVMVTVVAANGEHIEHTLPDNTKIWLNAGSSIAYPEKFNKNRRYVELNGECYFNVNSDPENPFEIKLNRMNVVVTGTRLNINAYMDENDIVVTLQEGKAAVELTAEEGDLTGKSRTYPLSPNQRLVFNVENENVKLEDTDFVLPAWMSGGMVFENITLPAIIKAIERHYDIKAEYNPEMMPQGRYSIKFVRGEGPEECMALMKELVNDFAYKFEEGEKVVITSMEI